ncbi:MAG: Crp/Fnr family transcriptional regulator [Fibrobacteres bacterium]|nr:Crp/Fnr family transcriptional regulator [Fibrobacterota bacterium]
MSAPEISSLRTGQRPVMKQERTYKPGDDLFAEGAKADEMFMIQEGEVAILKKNEDSFIELAKLGKGASIGEMALLDDMPRSATVRAVQPTKVTIINRLAFNAVMEKVPLWLRSIVKIVSSRLRDANTRVGQTLLKDSEGGLASMMLLMIPKYAKTSGEERILSYGYVRSFMLFTGKLSPKSFSAALTKLVKRGLISVDKDSEGNQLITVKEYGALTLYSEYARAVSQGKRVPGSDLNDAHMEFLSNLGYVAQKASQQIPEGVMVPFSAIDFGEDKENRRLLNELQIRGLVTLVPPPKEAIVYDKSMLNRVKRIKKWLPAFEMKIEEEGSTK